MIKSSTERDHSDHKIIEILRKEFGDIFGFIPEDSSQPIEHISIKQHDEKGIELQKNLKKILEHLESLKNLIQLNITDTMITRLPDNIGNLTNLKVLLIYNNKLTRLP
ncbi:MAG: hypothetical protein ACTSYY_16490, partial [Promethearchaeota archaeon]